MAKDIVVQLKELAASTNRSVGKSTIYGAIGEIERLRIENKSLEIKINDLQERLLPLPLDHFHPTL